MARLESQAIGGYYPTPPHLVPRIAKLLAAPDGGSFALVDPCAGDGAALIGVAKELFTEEQLRYGNVQLYACELEASRSKALEARRGHDIAWGACDFLRGGDAFRVRWETQRSAAYAGSATAGASLLYLNPPYDLDPECGRLEERFLRRFAACLSDGGALVFLVPFYALAASAETLARDFESLACFRFPDADFGFKQVALIARKRSTLLAPDAAVRAQVAAWAADASTIPELPPDARGAVADVPAFEPYKAGFASWKIAALDLTGLLARARPWYVSDRGGRIAPMQGIVPTRPALEMLARTYPVAMPPKPAHLCAGIAAGIFNGARVEPDRADSNLPALLVKGTFDREFVTIDERQNKEGDKTGEVQVQTPKLMVTALDLRSKRYHTLKSEVEVTGARDVAEMTTADLLASYGRSLTRVMLRQCPVLHDPALPEHVIELPELPRKLYRAQAHATMGVVKLLGGPGRLPKSRRRGLCCYVLGEIGSGKSTIALAAAATIEARRVAILCPPHLLDSWRDQAAAVVPGARVVVLRDLGDIDAFAAATDEGMVIGVLSREAAKLGHSWAGVGPVCPSCGGFTPGDVDLARKRARCALSRREPSNQSARLALSLGEALLSVYPARPDVAQLFQGRFAQRVLARAKKAAETPGGADAAWPRVVARGAVQTVALRLAAKLALSTKVDNIFALGSLLTDLYAAVPEPRLGETICRALWTAASKDEAHHGIGAELRRIARRLMLLVPGPLEPFDDSPAWSSWLEERSCIRAKRAPQSYDFDGISFEDGLLSWRKSPLGDSVHALRALNTLTQAASWTEVACRAPLFQAVPEPRRYPLATYLARRHPNLLDLLVLDEGHEYAGDGSAQGFAAHRLVGLGIPTMLMTGSVMSGYAESLYANQWALDPDFRREFPRGSRQEFVRRYGYIKQLVEMKDDGKAVSWGSVTDRCERTERTIGQAPGVLPLFVLRYLLKRAVTLHKSDLALDLPKCHELVDVVEPTAELKERFDRLKDALVEQIKEDRFTPLAGKLWGQMSELPSYLDRATADTGNVDGGAYEIAYPLDCGGGVVAREEPLPASTILPKEQWMLDRVKAELAEGRRCLVFAWHGVVLPRLQRLLETELGEPVPLLDAGKIAASKRQGWIDREVIGKSRRVLLVNPVCVQTGLNNLVWFSTEIWMQNPGCNAVVYRQATGRVDRIGKTQESRIYFPVYAGTAQAELHKLLLHKVGVSMSTDGLDAESALNAAGVGSTGFDGIAVGQLLYEMLVGERKAPEVALTYVPAPAARPVEVRVEAKSEPKPIKKEATMPEESEKKYQTFEAVEVEAVHQVSGARQTITVVGRYGPSFEARWPLAGLCAFSTTTGGGVGRMRDWCLTKEALRKLRGDDAYEPAPPVARKSGARPRLSKAERKPDGAQLSILGAQ